MSEKEKVAAGRWERVENLTRYVRGIVIGDGAMARLRKRCGGDAEKGPADLGSEM